MIIFLKTQAYLLSNHILCAAIHADAVFMSSIYMDKCDYLTLARGINVLTLMETKYNRFALGVISSGTWCPVTLHCDRAFSLCEEHHLLSVN